VCVYLVGPPEDEVWLQLLFGPWPDSSMHLKVVVTSRSHLWQVSIVSAMVVPNSRSSGCLHYQLLALATAILYKSICIPFSTGPVAISGGRSSPPLLVGGGGDPPGVFASRRWGPTYITVYTQCTEPWADFSEVLQLLMLCIIFLSALLSFFTTQSLEKTIECVSSLATHTHHASPQFGFLSCPPPPQLEKFVSLTQLMSIVAIQ
jgi:hypothetical protein